MAKLAKTEREKKALLQIALACTNWLNRQTYSAAYPSQAEAEKVLKERRVHSARVRCPLYPQ